MARAASSRLDKRRQSNLAKESQQCVDCGDMHLGPGQGSVVHLRETLEAS